MSSIYYGNVAGEQADHFPGCHPEDAEDTRKTPDPIPDTENCWHCGTLTTRGACGCADCWEGDDYVPVSSVYHCPLCKRWWAYMIPRITKITFGAGD